MNIAFPALVLIALFLPGVIWRRAYFSLPKDSGDSLDQATLFSRLVQGIVISIPLHLLWLAIANCIGYWNGELGSEETLLQLLSLPQDSSEALSAMADNAGGILVYFISLYLGAFVLGRFCNLVARRRNWDVSTKWYHAMFPRLNEWYYLLTIDPLRTKPSPDIRILAPNIDELYLAVVLDVGGGPILYYGRLTDYFLKPAGQLDWFVLTNVVRRKFGADREPGKDHSSGGLGDDRFYPVEGTYVIIRCSDVSSINIECIRLELEEIPPQSATVPPGSEPLALD